MRKDHPEPGTAEAKSAALATIEHAIIQTVRSVVEETGWEWVVEGTQFKPVTNGSREIRIRLKHGVEAVAK